MGPLCESVSAHNLSAQAAQEVRKSLGIREKEKPRWESKKGSRAGNVAGDQELVWHRPGPELSSQKHRMASHQTNSILYLGSGLNMTSFERLH